MNHDSSGSTNRAGVPAEGSPTPRSRGARDPRLLAEQRRDLELELCKLRSEASAARLDARAAEIELMIRNIGSTESSGGEIPEQVDTVPIGTVPIDTTRIDAAKIDTVHNHLPSDPNPDHATPFASWDAVRSVLPEFSIATAAAGIVDGPQVVAPPTTTDRRITRFDGGHVKMRAPHFLDEQPESFAAQEVDQPSLDQLHLDQPLTGHPIEIENPAEQDVQTLPEKHADEADDQSDERVEASGRPTPEIATPAVPELSSSAVDFSLNGKDGQQPLSRVSGSVSIDPDAQCDDEESTRVKPAAWLVSAIVHVGILVALAVFTLNSHHPKDQVALLGSTVEASDVAMETFEITTTELVTEPTDPTPSEAELDLSPEGKIAASELKIEGPTAPPSQAVAAMASSSVSQKVAMTLKSDSTAKMRFCGVEGGGNHFVYLVDSSGSMRGAFEFARRELLASIDLLTPEQRFYVVFFDAAPDYMRLSDPNVDEPRSVNATSANKAALRRWAMRISMDRGRAPYDPLKFVLKLKPDVIFLLSDGEFPQSFEDLAKAENKVENLFGDSHPISIMHTIGYHSKEGETRMRRIADQFGGQYRHVPKP